MIDKFLEIYNKRRTRLFIETIKAQEQIEITPKFEKVKTERQVEIGTRKEYIEDSNGEFVKCQSKSGLGSDYVLSKKENIISEDIFILRKDNFYWNNMNEVITGVPIKYFREEIRGGEGKFETVTEYKDVPYTGEKKYELRDVTRKSEQTVRDTNIVGTALAFSTTIWELLLCSKTLWSWFVGLVTDGYWMVLFSPLVLTYWVLATVLYIPLFALLSVLVGASFIYTLIFEFPAGFMNKEKNQYFEVCKESINKGEN